MTLILIIAPAFYAQEDYRTPAKASWNAMLLNAFLNAWFIMGLGLGAASVAFATSIAAWYNCGMLIYALKEKNGSFISSSFWTGVGRVGLASAAASCVVMIVSLVWPAPSNSFIMQTTYFAILTTTFFASLWGFAHLFKAYDLLHILKTEPQPT